MLAVPRQLATVRSSLRYAVSVGVVFALAGPAWSQTYTFVELGTLGGTHSSAAAINNAGQVVGSARTAGDVAARPVKWSGSTAIDVGTLGGDQGFVYAINASGEMCGYTRTALNAWHATSWIGTSRHDLGMVDNPSGGGASSTANGINDDGEVVGSGQTADYYKHGTIWRDPTEMHDFAGWGALVDSHANAINNTGGIVGWRNINEAATPMHAALWSGATYTLTDLGTLGGTNSYATAVNDAGVVVGNAQLSGQTAYRATRWNPGSTAIDLGTLGGSASTANGINAGGIVVGSAQLSGNTVSHAVLWTGTATIDLNNLLDPAVQSAGWVLTSATDINDNGWIVGNASNTSLGGTRGFLLIPPAAAAEVFCAGDGSVVACPCGNNGIASGGCANSTFVSGAGLSASGIADLSADSVTLNATQLTGATCIFLQGSAEMAPVAIDDGLTCLGGALVRLATKPVPVHSAQFPESGDALLSVRGGISPIGGTYVYQCYYRNAAVGFCPPATSNRTNGVRLTWTP